MTTREPDPLGPTERERSEDVRVISALSKAMLSKMRANAHKAHWSTVSQEWLLARLGQEVSELARALCDGDAAAITAECADVANFAAMIADNARRGA